MDLWNNGAKGAEVKSIVAKNFEILSKHLGKNILCLSTQERYNLTQTYLSDGLVVYDTDRGRWYQYKNNSWVQFPLMESQSPKYTYEIKANEWELGCIYIPFNTERGNGHQIPYPTVNVWLGNDSEGYKEVITEVQIDSEHNVYVFSDIDFDGKIIIS